MYEVIGTQYLGEHFILRQGSTKGARIPVGRFDELRRADADDRVPGWLADVAQHTWGVDPAGQSIAGTVLVRPDSAYGYSRASYELNLGCNYDCEHCYLGLKLFEG